MAEISEILPFCERSLASCLDGTYVSVRSGTSRRHASVEERYGPDGRHDDTDQEELDQLFSSPERMAEELTELALDIRGEDDSVTVWCETYRRGAKRPHERVMVDVWPEPAADAKEAKRRQRSLERLVKTDPNAAMAASLVRALEAKTATYEGLIREVSKSLVASRAALFREVEASRQAAIAELDARVSASLGDSEERAARQAANAQMMSKLIELAGPALAQLAVGGMGTPAPAPVPPPGPPPEPGTVDADADALLAELERLAATEEGSAAIMQRQARIADAARTAAMRASGGGE